MAFCLREELKPWRVDDRRQICPRDRKRNRRPVNARMRDNPEKLVEARVCQEFCVRAWLSVIENEPVLELNS